jgi:hypothetical protein
MGVCMEGQMYGWVDRNIMLYEDSIDSMINEPSPF